MRKIYIRTCGLDWVLKIKGNVMYTMSIIIMLWERNWDDIMTISGIWLANYVKRFMIVIAYLKGSNESYSLANEKWNESIGQDHALVDNNSWLGVLYFPNEVNINVIII